MGKRGGGLGGVRRAAVEVKDEKSKAAAVAGISRRDVETLIDIARKRAALLLRLKEAYLQGDATPVCASDIVREICGLPKEQSQ